MTDASIHGASAHAATRHSQRKRNNTLKTNTPRKRHGWITASDSSLTHSNPLGLTKTPLSSLPLTTAQMSVSAGRFGKGQPVREQEAHVPLFIRLPEGDTGRSNVIVQPQDFFPTILNILGETRPDGLEGHDILTPARDGNPGDRELALSGGSIERWQQASQNENAILFTAFDQEWSLEVAAKPENSKLVRLGDLEYVQDQHPDIVAKLHAVAIDEIEHRGTDPALMAWLRSGGEDAFPEDAHYWDGFPGPEGYRPYFGKLYTGE